MFPRKKKWGKAIWFKGESKRPKAAKKAPSKRSADTRTYNAKVKLWKLWPENRDCGFPGCRKAASDCHHTHGKAGNLLFCFELCVPLCRAHHNFVGQNIEASRNIISKSGLRLLCDKGWWNRNPRYSAKNLTFAPFLPKEVKHLNEWQEGGSFHPFTCCEVLLVSERGFRCPTCGGVQLWCHDFMAHPVSSVFPIQK